MNKIKVLSVFGTRPEAIKMCPLVKLLEKDDRFESIVCVTAQHREMLDAVLEIFDVKPQYDLLEIFDVKPQYDLNIMSHGQTIIDVANKVLTGVDKVIKECKPDIVLVHGDTSTTLNGALAAFYNQVPIGHVEAGLRTGDIYSPFPEEANRKLTGTITTLHFAPTESNKRNLEKENITKNVYITGNTVIDALLSVVDKNYKFQDDILNNIDFTNNKVVLLTAHRRENWGEPMKDIFAAVRRLEEENEEVQIIFPMHRNPLIRELAKSCFEGIEEKIHLIEPLEYVDFANLMSKGNTVIDALLSVVDKNHKFQDDTLNNIDFTNNKVVLLTAHRRENWGEPMKDIFASVRRLAEENEEVQIIFPMHRNPLIRELAKSSFEGIEEKIHLIEPLEYVDFANLMSRCYLIMTDSGGIQEEAPALGKPVMVLRTETERPEAVEAGTVKLVGIDKETIFNIASKLVNDNEAYEKMAHAANPYGDGEACARILERIFDWGKTR